MDIQTLVIKKIAVLLILLSITIYFGCSRFKETKLHKQQIITDNKPKRIPSAKKPTSLIVKFKPNQSPETKKGVLDKFAGPVVTRIEKIGAYQTKPENISVATAISRLNDQPSVEYAEPNRSRKAFITPNDSYFKYQYGSKLIHGPAGWDTERGESNLVTIAIVDTGVDLTHPDLSSKIVQGTDTINNDNNPSDDHGHGTHIAGISAAMTNNSRGVAGISWGAKIMPVKVLDEESSGTDTTVSEGIIWASDHGAKVINMSLGGYFYSQTMQDATDYALSKGVIVLAAAGNEGTDDILYPAGNKNVLGIGAVESSGLVADFSNHNKSVDLTAPGVDALSTYWDGGHIYAYLSGTSMATSFASGTAALVYSKYPEKTASQIADRMTRQSIDFGSLGRDDYYGYGRVDVQFALSDSVKYIRAKSSRRAVRRMGRAKIYGQIRPQQYGERVHIKIRYSSSRRWRYISHPKTNNSGNFVKYIRLRKTAYFKVIYDSKAVNLKVAVRR